MDFMEVLKLFSDAPGYIICLIVIWLLFKQLKEKDTFTSTLLNEVNKSNATLVELTTLVKVLVDRGSKK